MKKQLDTINSLLVSCFNEVLKVEEASLQASTKQNVTITEMHILDCINKAGSPTISDLAAASLVTVSTMTIAINRMQTKALVDRVRIDPDRRIVRVKLTESGLKIANAHQKFHRSLSEHIVSTLSCEEQDVLVQALTNLNTYFQAEKARCPRKNGSPVRENT